MLKARGSIELVVRIRKSQPLQKPTRRDILRVMAGENRPCPADRERMLDDTRGRLERIALSPVPRGDVHAELGNVRVACAHSQAAAAHVLARGNQEEGPILNTVNMLSVDLELAEGPSRSSDGNPTATNRGSTRTCGGGGEPHLQG